MIVDESFGLLLEKIVRDEVDADVQDGQAVEGALVVLVPFTNVGDRLTEGRMASASSRIEELEKHDVAGHVRQLQRRARIEHAPRQVSPGTSCV